MTNYVFSIVTPSKYGHIMLCMLRNSHITKKYSIKFKDTDRAKSLRKSYTPFLNLAIKVL